MSNPGESQSLTDLMAPTVSDSGQSDAPPSFMTPIAHAAAPTPPVLSILPDGTTLPDATVDAPEYARPTGATDVVRVDTVTVPALSGDLSSIASTVGGANSTGISDSVAAGMPGSDTAWSCISAEAALSSALNELHSRFIKASDNVTASLETYLATDAANADGIGKAAGR